MKKLLLLALALPCLVGIANTINKVILIVKNNGDKVAVMVNDVDSIVVEDADIVDDRYFLLDKDTVYITDTLIQTDTITERDTIIEIVRDTIIQVDTLIERDTIIEVDTVIDFDTLVFNDTIDVHDTTYVYETVNRTINVADKWYYNLENPSVCDFLNSFEYKDDDYSYSYIDNYLVDTDYDKERPLGVMLQWDKEGEELLVADNPTMFGAYWFKFENPTHSFCIYNLIPGKKYYWQVKSAGDVVNDGHFFTNGRVRMINLEGVHNVRDIGGMPTSDGHRLAYGKFFRGGILTNLTDNDRSILKDTLGITAEVDVIAPNDNTTSPTLGEDVAYSSFKGYHINWLTLNSNRDNTNTFAEYRKTLQQILSYLREGKVVYLHCGGGADRTGAIAILLEGLAGCSESDIAKDYEMTSFSIFGTRKRVNGVRYEEVIYDYASTIQRIKNNGKATFQENIIALMKKYGLTDDEIEELRSLLVE